MNILSAPTLNKSFYFSDIFSPPVRMWGSEGVGAVSVLCLIKTRDASPVIFKCAHAARLPGGINYRRREFTRCTRHSESACTATANSQQLLSFRLKSPSMGSATTNRAFSLNTSFDFSRLTTDCARERPV